ncbi:4-amino-4-deoxychorismate lyase [Brumimicrobium salinarum]|uniref:branched-chain-amino-acid transaminase n=1 Tax=Brumimicrobium salinarum TaxID=2058658 RepID=A0A2I0R0J5_9FLAO|nr:aminotransferase class IV [Brumimicrobium salinarum]PKR80112.1 4-amino-4-deoxychorismate lyase [Brumimicrobium salinarum]
MEKLYVNNNGELLENNEPSIRAGNRAHLYGDGLFESIRVISGKPINLEVHILRLKEGMAALKMRIPNFFTVSFFEKQIETLLSHSGIKNGGRIRLSVDRSRGGTYTPATNEVSFLIEAHPLENNQFLLNNKGLEVDLFTEIKKENNKLANFKTKNGLIYILGAIEAQEKDLDDLLILNNKGGIIESTNSNLFVVSNGVLYTPSLDEGCLGGTMRMTIINMALENNIKVYESAITPQNLLIADEVFLSNAINGVKWVGGYRTKRYMNTISMKFIHLLNEKFSNQTMTAE